jgi:proton glutamate symport protein
MKLHNQIFLGLAGGIIVGAVAMRPESAGIRPWVVALAPFGTVFIRLVTMVVIPLVVASLTIGIASLGDIARLGRIGGRTLGWFLATTVIAAVIGVATARLVRLGEPLPSGGSPEAGRADVPTPVEPQARDEPGLVQTLIEIVPQNPFASAARGDLLPLIIAVCIFGAAATVVRGEGRRTVIAFFAGVNDLSMVVIGWMMRLAPVAVFALIAAAVAQFGIDLLRSLLEYALVVVLALAVHVAVVLVVILRLVARVGVPTFVRAVSDALLLAFSTASSNVTLPVSMAAATGRLGVPNEIASFVLPAGTTLNKNGSAVYKAVTAVFIGRLYGVDLGAGGLVTIVLASTAAAFAGAGVPASSLVTTLIVLHAIGLGPRAASGIALVAGIDRPLDMCRTTVNTFGNLVIAAVVARSEGQSLRPRRSREQ